MYSVLALLSILICALVVASSLTDLNGMASNSSLLIYKWISGVHLMASDMVQLSLGKCVSYKTLRLQKQISFHYMRWCCYNASICSFDHFHIIRQGFLLSIDTFGVSHILPILSLPFIAIVWYNTTSKDNELKDVILNNINKVLNMVTFSCNKENNFVCSWEVWQ